MNQATAARRPAAVTAPGPAKDIPPAGTVPVPAGRPGALSALRARHGAALAPWWWTAQAASAGFTAHALPGLEPKMIAAGVLSAAAAGLGTRNVVTRKRSRRVRRAMAAAVAGGSAWTFTAAGAGPMAGHYHLLLIALAAGGAVTGAHWRRVSAAPRRALPAKAAAAAAPEGKAVKPDDPRVAQFRDWFCRPGMPLHKAALEFAEIGGGFTVDFVLDPDGDRTVHDLGGPFLRRLALKYDVPLDQVGVEESPVRRSAGRGRITVLTSDAAMLEPEWWDGEPTYDPETGTVVIGRFMDGTPLHWLVHLPGSGAAGGLIAGTQGYGKTTTVLDVVTESAKAKLCRACGKAKTCRRCRVERIVCTWAGDPTCKPFLQLKGRADLTAWGPRACIVMMCWAVAALRAREGADGDGWTDHLGRFHEGREQFDPTPQVPVLQVTVDEWPRIVKRDDGAYATGAVSEVFSVGRKFGVAPNLITLLPDLPYLGDRDVRELALAYNVVSHRTDGMSKGMLGIEGDPQKLPKGVAGPCYASGIDRRPAMQARVKGLKGVRDPGGSEPTDARELWDKIALEPVDLEPAVMAVLGPLGYTGRGQVLRDEDVTPGMWAAALAAAGFQPPDGYGQVAVPAVPGAGPAGPAAGAAVPADHLAAARVIAGDVAGEGRGADVFDLMERSAALVGGDGLSALDAERAAEALVASGDLVKAGGLYVPAAGGETP